MRLRTASVAVLGLFLVAGFAVSATETASVGSVTGNVTLEPDGSSIVEGAEVGQGDTITLAAGAFLTLTFEDGATLDVTGPASFRLTHVDSMFRTVDLIHGYCQLTAREIVMGIRTPYNCFVATQESTVSVRIDDQPDRTGVTFMMPAGDTAIVVDERQYKRLDPGRPIVVWRMRDGMGGPALSDEEMRIGEHVVTVVGPQGFEMQPLPNGGRRFVRRAEGFGLVLVDGSSAFYLGQGDSIEFDAAGNVVDHSGIVHVYSPLTYRGLYDEPIEDAASASFTGTKVK